MSVSLLHPAALWAALLLVLVVALHLMQSRWKRRVVGSLILWRRVAARGVDLRARRPALDLALVLGLAGTAALVVTGAGPALVKPARAGRETVVVIDNGTASLTESPPARDRLDEAARLADAELSHLGRGTRAAVVATSPSPCIVARMGDPSAARRALAGVRPRQVTGSLSAAVSLALAEGAGEVAVFTGRALPPAPARVRRIAVGRASANVGIVRADFSDAEAFVAVRSFSARPAAVRLSLRAVEPASRELASAEVRLAPGARADVVLAPEGSAAVALAGARAVAVELSSPADDLAADNIAFAARSAGGARRVGLVGEPGEALARALWAARVETVSLAGGAVPEEVDLLVYVVETPASWPPPRPALLVAPERSFGPVEVLDDEVRDARGLFAGSEREGSPTEGFPPTDLRIARARRARIFGGSRALVESGGEMLAAELGGEGGPFVYLGFRPEDSDWPGRASFPVFVARVLEAAGSRGGAGGRLEFARVGEIAARLLPQRAAAVRLPGGPDIPRAGRILKGGLYRADGALLAANLVSERESDNRPAPELPGPRPGAPGAGAPRPARSVRDLASAFAAAGLALLAAEWLVSARRS